MHASIQFPQSALSPDGRAFDAASIHGHAGPSGAGTVASAAASARSLSAAAAASTGVDPRFQFRASSSGEHGFDGAQAAAEIPQILIPHEIACLKELLTVVGKLDAPTKTSIRDSLLRLARNAEMRKQGIRMNWKDQTTPDGALRMNETTSKIDREVAQLLFSSSVDPHHPRPPASDANANRDGRSGSGSFPS